MSDRADLHRLVDELPEDSTAAAARILECLRDEKRDELSQALRESPDDSFLRALAAAPEDDEPETPEEAAAVQEAIEELDRGEGIPWEEAKKHLFPEGL
ncbi:MAG: hypothetical protein FJX76_26835 [Armatimonadetes bacterium]|nr:hypothetical protein [Armatimonadota bacterium]